MLAEVCYPCKTMTRLRGTVLGALVVLMGAGLLYADAGRPVEWSRLPPDAQKLIQPVVGKPQISRDVGNITYPSRREIWEYLLDYPDFAADVARALHEGRYHIRRVGDHYDAEDGRGVRAIMRPLYAAAGRRIFYLEGRYDTKWLPTLKGRAVLVLDSDYTKSAAGAPEADVRVLGYLRIDNVFVAALVAIVKDFGERTFDSKVRKFFSHVERVNRRASEDPRGLLALLETQPALDRERLAEFRHILLGPTGSPRPTARLYTD